MTELNPYLGILLLSIAAAGFLITMVLLAAWVGPKNPTVTKQMPWECGAIPVGSVKDQRFNVRFYLVAMIFILFDIEVIFMYPWAVTFKELARTDLALGLGGMLSFLGIVFVGYVYAVKKRAFDWKS